MKKRLLRKRIKTGGVYLGFDTLKGRKFPYGNFRTSVFCKVKTQIVGKTKFFDSLRFTVSYRYGEPFILCRREEARIWTVLVNRKVLQKSVKKGELLQHLI